MEEHTLKDHIQKIYDQHQGVVEGEGEEEIDINDYVVADEDQEFRNHVNLLNIYTCYFKQLFRRNQGETLFDHVDYDKKNSTNKCMEFLYDEINKFNESTIEDKDILYEPDDISVDINKCTELYTLYINSEPLYLSKFLLPLFQYLATIDWYNIEWSIIPIKG